MENNIFELNVLEKRFDACFISRGLSFLPAFDKLVKSAPEKLASTDVELFVCFWISSFRNRQHEQCDYATEMKSKRMYIDRI